METVRRRMAPGSGRIIAVDEGWYQLVVSCDAELTLLDEGYLILQIKEKFGGLRFYMEPKESTKDDVREKMQEIVDGYEAMSLKTCEATGQTGVMMSSPSGWYKTLNPEFAAGTPHLSSYREVVKGTI